MSENNNAISIDDLLDGTLDDLADAPTFKPFAAGVYTLKIKWDLNKKVSDMPGVGIGIKVMEVHELVNPETDTPPAIGDETELFFPFKKKDKETNQIVANEFGQGQFKNIITALKADLGLEGKTNREVTEATDGMELMGVTGIRIDKRNKEDIKYYTELKSLNAIA